MPMAYIPLYFSYAEQLKMLSDADRGKLVLALLEYGETGTIPELRCELRMAFSFIKSQIDRDCEKYEKRCRTNSENANKRWHDVDAAACDGMQTDAKHAKEKEKKKKKESIDARPEADTPTRSKRTVFVPPTLDAVAAYCAERNNGIDPQRFLDYYAANGWHVGKSTMKDWKAAVRNWERMDNPPARPEAPPEAPPRRMVTTIDETGKRVATYA